MVDLEALHRPERRFYIFRVPAEVPAQMSEAKSKSDISSQLCFSVSVKPDNTDRKG